MPCRVLASEPSVEVPSGARRTRSSVRASMVNDYREDNEMLTNRWPSLVRGLPLLLAMTWPCTRIAAQESTEEAGAVELEELKSELERLRARDAENREKLEALRMRIDAMEAENGGDASPTATPSPLDRALAEVDAEPAETSPLDEALADVSDHEPDSTDIWSRQLGTLNLRLIDISVDLLVAAGSSTERDSSIENLQGGGHDPHQRGFTLQNLELSFMGAVDPYFTMETHLIYFVDAEGESQFELEEAFLTTQQLPFGLEEKGLELEVGQFFTEFGRLNPQHPHAWDWIDQPVVNSRFFGPDGMRGVGVRLGWLTPVPWFCELHLGLQNSDGETMASFLASDEFFDERPIGGRPFTDQEVRSLEDFVYLARLDNSWDLSEEVAIKLGASGLVGSNATGSDAMTYIYGADFLLKWRPLTSDRGFPYVTWQTEIMRRDFEADDFFDAGDPVDPTDDVILDDDTLHDWGVYTQVVYGFVRNWAVGLRYGYSGGKGRSVEEYDGRDEDPFRDNRHRLSPLVSWQATEFSRIRLQYNYDEADHLDDNDAHSVWVGFEVLLGQHPAHAF